MKHLNRPITAVLIVVAMLVAFAAGTMVASGSPAAAPEALTPGQQVAVQTSNWLMTTGVTYTAFLPLILRQY
jgi:zinc transporter ZupT